jgi:hypothetical protein
MTPVSIPALLIRASKAIFLRTRLWPRCQENCCKVVDRKGKILFRGRVFCLTGQREAAFAEYVLIFNI